LSQSTERLTCISCGSNNITFDPSDQTVSCNDCGVVYIVGSYNVPKVMSSGSVTVGTMVPKPLVKTEEFGYRKITQVFPHEHPEFKTLENEITDLKKSIDQLDDKVDELRGYSPKVVVIEEIPKEEARKKVEEYFKEHGTADIEELMMNLKIPVPTLVEILDDLKREGKITARDDEKI